MLDRYANDRIFSNVMGLWQHTWLEFRGREIGLYPDADKDKGLHYCDLLVR